MPDDSAQKPHELAWRIHGRVFEGQSVRDRTLLQRLRRGGNAVACYLFKYERRAQQWAKSPQTAKTANRLLRRGRSLKVVDAFVVAESPSVPTDPVEALGRTTDPKLAAGVLAAFHDWELRGEVGVDFKGVPTILPISGRWQAVHKSSRIVGRTWQNKPDSFAHIVGAFLRAVEDGRDLAAALQVRRHLDEVCAGRDAPANDELRRTAGDAGKLDTATDPEADTPKAVHNADFTMVKWYGTEYTFALGVQSSAVQALWAEWDKTGLGLHQDTIRNAIDAERDSFRMDTAFRNHPAFGTMIQRCGDGKYKLAPPSGEPPAPTAPGKKKRQKRA